MKKITTILCVSLAGLVAGNAQSPNDSLTQEASRVAQETLALYFDQRDDTWRTLVRENGEHGLGGLQQLELKSVTTTVRAEPLTPADKLNGLEWKGLFVYRPTACREYYPKGNSRFFPVSPGWTEWHDGNKFWVQVIAQKKHGKWIHKFQIKDQTENWEDVFLFFVPVKPQAETSSADVNKNTPFSDVQLVGSWQGSRTGIEFLPNHTFKRDGLFIEGMKWRIDGHTLSEWNPVENPITPTSPLPGVARYNIVSLNGAKLVLENKDGTRFVRYRLFSNSEPERESAAGRAKDDTIAANKK